MVLSSHIDVVGHPESSKPKPRALLRQSLVEGVAAPCTQCPVVSAVAAIGAESEYCIVRARGSRRAEPDPGRL